MQKHISNGLQIARRENTEAAPKVVTVRILKPEYDNGVKSSVLIAGKIAKYGDLADVTEAEANDLIQRGRAELAVK